ncbi:MAG: sugar ABC transporter permease [Thermoanaerobaculia bacterium]
MSTAARPGRGTRAESRAGLLLLLPALAAIVLFFAVPVLAGLLLSFTDFDLYAVADIGNARWIGFSNYLSLLRDPLFWLALRNTLILVALGLPATIATGLGGALLVHSRLARFRGLYRTIFFAPVVSALVAVAIVWRSLYHPRYGLLDHLLGAFGLPAIDWLGDPAWSLPAIALLSVWRNFGYVLVILVAGLGSIPESLYEAAKLDGASAWQQFRHVTLPSLVPTLLFCGVLTTVGLFQIFAEPYVMTRGGPLNSTTTVALFMYQQGFRWWSMGRASAIAFVLFALVLAASFAQAALRRESKPVNE